MRPAGVGLICFHTSRRYGLLSLSEPYADEAESETFTAPDADYAASHNITWDVSVHGFEGPVQASHAPYDYPGSGQSSSRQLQYIEAYHQ